MCYSCRILSLKLNGVGISGVPKFGNVGPRPLTVPLEARSFSTRVIMTNVIVVGQTIREYETIGPLASRGSVSLTFIGADTDRSVTYDFLP